MRVKRFLNVQKIFAHFIKAKIFKQMKRFIILTILYIATQNISAQKPTEFFNSKKAQHSVSLEVASLAYTYIH